MNEKTTSFQYGEHTVTLKAGKIARQASGAVFASMGDTTVMVTMVAQKEENDRDFFPLTVDYEERTYAAGKIPGSFFKREGRPSEKAILTCRLMDRPLRPLFPKGFSQEVQIVSTVMSIDSEIDPDIVAMIGAAAAIEISGVPFNGPVGACRVGFVNGEYVLNPDATVLKEDSQLDLVVAGTTDAVLMVESEADMLSEKQMLDAVMYGHAQLQTAIEGVREFAAQFDIEHWDWKAPEADANAVEQVAGICTDSLTAAYQIAEKMDRYAAIDAAKAQMKASLLGDADAKFAEECSNSF